MSVRSAASHSVLGDGRQRVGVAGGGVWVVGDVVPLAGSACAMRIWEGECWCMVEVGEEVGPLDSTGSPKT